MADLGAIGIRVVSEAARSIPLDTTAPTGNASSISPARRCIFDCADAASVQKNYPRAVEVQAALATIGRQARYLKDQLQVRGTVKDSAGTGISRRVLIINREGACVGKTRSAGDGTFSVTLYNQGTEFVACMAIPEDADTRNAVVKWKVQAVAQA